ERLHQNETDGGQASGERQEDRIAAEEDGNEEDVKRQREREEDRRQHDRRRPERRGFRREHRYETRDRERGDPDEERELSEAPSPERNGRLRMYHCSSLSATRPIASSSPYCRRSRDLTTSPFTTVPFVLPASSTHHP